MGNDVKIRVTADTTQAQSAFKNFADGATDLVNTIDVLSKVSQTFSKIMEFGKQGAIVTQTTQSFDGLLKKVGANTDLLQQLQEASNGTISDLKLMSATTTLLAGTQGDLATSLANATPELLEIAKAANKLNPSLGDTAFLYESIATGVKRASPMILDNLGLTIKIGDANEKYAKALGKTVEELTADEQKQALLNATLEAGRTLIDQAGGSAENAADAYAQMEVALENAGNAAKAKFAPFITNAANAVVFLLTNSERLHSFLVEHAGEVYKTADSYEAYSSELNRAAGAARMYVDEEGNLRDSHGRLQQANYMLSESMWETMRAVEGVQGGFVGYSQTIESVPDDMAGLPPAFESVWRSAENAAEAVKKAADMLQNDLPNAINSVREAEQNFANKEGGDVASALQSAGLEGDRYREALGYVDEALGTSLGVQADYKQATEELAQKFKDGEITADEFKEGLIRIKDEFAPFDEAVQKSIDKLKELNDKLDALNGRHIKISIDIEQNEFRSPGQDSGGGAIGEAERKAGQDINGNGIIGARYGAQYVIPPGFNENYYVGGGVAGSSGETVTVTPQGQAAGIVIQQVILPGVSNAQQFLRELGNIAHTTQRAGGGYVGR